MLTPSTAEAFARAGHNVPMKDFSREANKRSPPLFSSLEEDSGKMQIERLDENRGWSDFLIV